MIAAVLGWVGTIGTMMAYLLANRGRLSINSRRYAMANAVGGVLSGTASVLYGAWPSAAASFVWALVGAHALLIGVARGPSPFTAARSLARSRGSRRVGTSSPSRQPRHVGIVTNHASAMPSAPRCTSGVRPSDSPESCDSSHASRHSNAHIPAPSPGLPAACRVDRGRGGQGDPFIETKDAASAHSVGPLEETAPPTPPEKFALTCVMSTTADNEAVRVVSA